MTKQEASDIFDSKEDVLDELLDYILIEKDYDKATRFIMDVVGCEESIARLLVLETIPSNTDIKPITKCLIECPYCHSKNTKKISGLSKAGSVALWGIFAAGKVAKQWHCNNCKSDF